MALSLPLWVFKEDKGASNAAGPRSYVVAAISHRRTTEYKFCDPFSAPAGLPPTASHNGVRKSPFSSPERLRSPPSAQWGLFLPRLQD